MGATHETNSNTKRALLNEMVLIQVSKILKCAFGLVAYQSL